MAQMPELWDAPYMNPVRQTPWQTFVAAALMQLPRARDFYDKQLQKRLGTKGKPLYDISRGKSQNPGPSTLRHIAEVLMQPVDLVSRAANGEDVVPAAVDLDGEPDEGRSDTALETIEIQEWDYAYGMGSGTYLDLPVTGELHQFSPGWMTQFTRSPPEKVFLARGTGDSMMPTILDTDVVIIDTAEREVRTGDKLWAVAIGSVGYIKRLRPMPDGGVKILSDNPSVPPETAYDSELNIVGRVVAIVRKT
ncbi:helix-turn-helix transcriptional regulator [Sphingobium phenoxybenzoativorans]|uniref:Helix-turn-helix transcriptional regulator n=1 Tax=Sphingobium phenoxybenzoativorans TaxID=1592790 RepID=A0A975KBN8_9SPHN|nr:helix-turn-helix transcriptional regulator [Sphingobium phenoxybenzoativorans]QUT07954.1 helix-turn-helix transcriptional regulator [Sphingobium phenoxybenzoativorans]